MNEDSEVLKRVRRIETRVMTMGTALGVNMREDKKFLVDVDNARVDLEQMDVTFSAVTNKARFMGLGGRMVTVYHKGELIARMQLKP